MRKKIPVSVIIPSYNSQATLNRAFDSVIKQSVLPEEVILVDDASTDNTLDIIYDLKRKNAGLVKVVEIKKNLGVASARNVGWDLSRCEFIAFLDSDDVWHSDKLEIQFNFMRKYSEIVLCGHLHKINLSQNADLDSRIPKPKFKIVRPLNLLIRNQFCTPSVMIKRSIPFRFKSGKRFAEDYLLWLEIGLSGFPIVKINSCLVTTFKRDYGSSGLSSNLLKMELGELGCYFELYKKNLVNLFVLLCISIYSILKFSKRLIFSYLNKGIRFF